MANSAVFCHEEILTRLLTIIRQISRTDSIRGALAQAVLNQWASIADIVSVLRHLQRRVLFQAKLHLDAGHFDDVMIF